MFRDLTILGTSANDPPTVSATVNGRVWHRAPGELEEAFLERVSAEARCIRPGVVLGFLA
jgi:hypothetical protein